MTRPEDKTRSTMDVVEDPDAPISEEEKQAAEELRLALEDPARDNEGAELLRAASLAHAPRPIDPTEHAALVQRALAPRSATVVRLQMRRRAVVAWSGAVAGAIALAAGVLLFIQTQAPSAPPAAATASLRVPLVQVRSTQPLFSEPFARTGGTSARIDRIAIARESDLRDNEFARWGVK